ncbi:UNKNOWN [Stylonychia lemnae]|uniref:Uncharacterized protein n=1 Tax=Stylonychia lemnae TaxID=5949 RepID=A0A078AKL6_STYLE|nr:UNKNOWN [Stylonychia lemnae]|eukprot:CDW82900.1 UNKNOWN [Stylonychia lemnae]
MKFRQAKIKGFIGHITCIHYLGYNYLIAEVNENRRYILRANNLKIVWRLPRRIGLFWYPRMIDKNTLVIYQQDFQIYIINIKKKIIKAKVSLFQNLNDMEKFKFLDFHKIFLNKEIQILKCKKTHSIMICFENNFIFKANKEHDIVFKYFHQIKKSDIEVLNLSDDLKQLLGQHTDLVSKLNKYQTKEVQLALEESEIADSQNTDEKVDLTELSRLIDSQVISFDTCSDELNIIYQESSKYQICNKYLQEFGFARTNFAYDSINYPHLPQFMIASKIKNLIIVDIDQSKAFHIDELGASQVKKFGSVITTKIRNKYLEVFIVFFDGISNHYSLINTIRKYRINYSKMQDYKWEYIPEELDYLKYEDYDEEIE